MKTTTCEVLYYYDKGGVLQTLHFKNEREEYRTILDALDDPKQEDPSLLQFQRVLRDSLDNSNEDITEL